MLQHMLYYLYVAIWNLMENKDHLNQYVDVKVQRLIENYIDQSNLINKIIYPRKKNEELKKKP
jgi:hypothetical protein